MPSVGLLSVAIIIKRLDLLVPLGPSKPSIPLSIVREKSLIPYLSLAYSLEIF